MDFGPVYSASPAYPRKVATMLPDLKTLYRTGGSHGQGYDLSVAYEHPRTFGKLLITVHHDTSYPRQSFAKVAVWRDGAWSEVASRHFTEWASKKGPGFEFYTEGTRSAHDWLLQAALAVLA